MSWYYVDPAGTTKGPMTLDALKPLYDSQIKDNTYLWNGTTVPQWTALNKLPDILKQLNTSSISQTVISSKYTSFIRNGLITLHKHNISANIIDRYATTKYVFDFENEQSYATELMFELTIDPDAFIAGFEANIDGEIFIGQTKEKEIAAKEYSIAKQKEENAILISQPHKDIPNVFKVSTNIDSNSKISLEIRIEQYLKKKFNFNELCIQILRNFKRYNITPKFEHIEVTFDISDECGVYEVVAPSLVIDEQTIDKMNKNCMIKGKVTSDDNEVTLKYKVMGESEQTYALFDNESGSFCQVITNNIFTNKDGDHKEHEGGKDTIDSVIVPRRVVFVIDKSGSMSGGKWRRSVTATINGLQKLRKEYDRLNIILFIVFLNLAILLIFLFSFCPFYKNVYIQHINKISNISFKFKMTDNMQSYNALNSQYIET